MNQIYWNFSKIKELPPPMYTISHSPLCIKTAKLSHFFNFTLWYSQTYFVSPITVFSSYVFCLELHYNKVPCVAVKTDCSSDYLEQ